MALKPITRQEQIIAGKNLEPITRMERFLKEYGGGTGGSVQSDWNQTDSSAADFIKNKPFYEGLQTIVEETTIEPDWSADAGIGFASLNVALNVTFEDGDDVVVVFNGESYQRKYVDRDGYGFWGNPRFVEEYLEDNGDPFCVINEFDNVIILVNTSAPYTISIHKHAVVYIDSKFIPDDVPKYGTAGELTRIEWDGNTDGLESFVYNAFNYYKVSDIVIPFTHISKLECKRKDNNVVFKRVYQGTNCYSADLIICVTVPGECESDEGKKFNAPSAGVYFIKNKYTTGWDWCRYLEIDTRRDNTILYLTNPSGVKYAITVDDNGTLTATEVT